MEQKKLQAAIEAILFAMGGSVELKKLAQAIGHDEETTKKIIRQMMDRYEKEDRGIRIIELEASFQMCTKKEMYEYLIRVAKQPKKQVLTDVLLETLSIIAYKQPVTKLEIEKILHKKELNAVFIHSPSSLLLLIIKCLLLLQSAFFYFDVHSFPFADLNTDTQLSAQICGHLSG